MLMVGNKPVRHMKACSLIVQHRFLVKDKKVIREDREIKEFLCIYTTNEASFEVHRVLGGERR